MAGPVYPLTPKRYGSAEANRMARAVFATGEDVAWREFWVPAIDRADRRAIAAQAQNRRARERENR